MKKQDKKFLEMTISLAKKGIGKATPNPLVGALLVKKGKVISTGFHKYFGGPHAEVNAIKNAKGKAEGATLYINLEPCAHYGKTPPCTEAIKRAKIKRVVIGMKDPNPRNNGRGVKALREAGIIVAIAKQNQGFKELNEIFIKYITKKFPFIIVKAAQTLDGKIATARGKSKWITHHTSRDYSQSLRNRVDAIMVGINTILKDDPLLSCRIMGKIKKIKPIKVVVDNELRVPVDARIFSRVSPARVIIATTKIAYNKKVLQLKRKGIEIMLCRKDVNGNVDIKSLMHKLALKDISSILVEGGGELIASCFERKLVDKVYFFIAPKVAGGRDAKTSVEGKGISDLNKAIKLKNVSITKFKEDMLIEAKVKY